MLPQCSHITRKRGVYYYRRRLPGAAKGEVTVSMRTRLFREAQWLAAKLDQEFGRIIANVNENKTPDINRIAREYLRRILDHDMEHRAASPNRPVYNMYFDPGASSEADMEWVETELQTAKTELRERLYDHQRPLIDEFMKDHAAPLELRGTLAHAILRVRVDFWTTVRERTLGDFSSESREQTVQLREPAIDVVAEGPLFSEVLPGFLDFMSQKQGWRGQTLAQNRSTHDIFVECCGDRPVASYERKDLAAFYDLLRALPRLYSKSAEWKGLPLAEIARLTKEQAHGRLAMKTVKRHFSALGRLFAYLKQRGEYLGENPAYGFDFPDKRRARDKRSMWEGASLMMSFRLTKLFSSPVWAGCCSVAASG